MIFKTTEEWTACFRIDATRQSNVAPNGLEAGLDARMKGKSTQHLVQFTNSDV